MSEHTVDAAMAVAELGDALISRDTMRAALEAADRARAPSACADAGEMRANHRRRALLAVASHICSSDMTDGSCGPKHGQCRWEKGDPQIGCVAKARGMLSAIESVGCAVLWERDPTLAVTIERKP